jgi:hypothetical protein
MTNKQNFTVPEESIRPIPGWEEQSREAYKVCAEWANALGLPFETVSAKFGELMWKQYHETGEVKVTFEQVKLALKLNLP